MRLQGKRILVTAAGHPLRAVPLDVTDAAAMAALPLGTLSI